MISVLKCIKDKAPLVADRLRTFFEGRIYPAVLAALILIGHVSGAEFYIAIGLVLAAALAFLVCPTLKPFIGLLMMFVYLVNTEHAPGIPNFSDYYFTPGKLATIIVLIAVLAAAVVYFLLKNVFPKIKTVRAPMLIPVCLFTVSLLLNGAFGGIWSWQNVMFGAVQSLIFFVLFYLMYYGLKDENTEAVIDYVIYVSALSLLVLAGEMVYLLMTSDAAISAEGAIVKEHLLFGWGISNSFGCVASVLIPLCILGAARARSKLVGFLYFGAAILAFALSVLSQSRNAVLFGAIALVLCCIICCFFGEGRRMFRVVCLIGVAACAVIMLLFGEEIIKFSTEYLSRGAGDSGRFELWRYGWDIFLGAPIFGGGFYAYNEYEIYHTFDFMPTMVHNTPIQLLSAMGIFGFIAYSIYRIASFIPVFKKMNFTKVMLAASIIVLLAESLLDNFIFYIYMAFPYIIVLAILHKMAEEEKMPASQA